MTEDQRQRVKDNCAANRLVRVVIANPMSKELRAQIQERNEVERLKWMAWQKQNPHFGLYGIEDIRAEQTSQS